jgi:hypothetical protein
MFGNPRADHFLWRKSNRFSHKSWWSARTSWSFWTPPLKKSYELFSLRHFSECQDDGLVALHSNDHSVARLRYDNKWRTLHGRTNKILNHEILNHIPFRFQRLEQCICRVKFPSSKPVFDMALHLFDRREIWVFRWLVYELHMHFQ